MTTERRLKFCGKRTPLSYAFANKKYDVFEFLIENGANIFTDWSEIYSNHIKYISYFHISAIHQDQQAIDILKKYHDINCFNDDGETVLQEMSKIYYISPESMIQFLIKNGLDIHACNPRGENAIAYYLQYMSITKSFKVFKCLRSLGVEYTRLSRADFLACSTFNILDHNYEINLFLTEDGFFEFVGAWKTLIFVDTLCDTTKRAMIRTGNKRTYERFLEVLCKIVARVKSLHDDILNQIMKILNKKELYDAIRVLRELLSLCITNV